MAIVTTSAQSNKQVQPDTLSAEQTRVLHKAAWRLIPLLALAYFFNYLDRTSVGYAALQMTDQLGLTATQFGLGAGIMFFGYCLCEVPSNLAMYRFGARLWMARIMITWGLAAAATALIVGPYSFYLVRLILGIAEAGFFPGVIFFLTLWFPAQYRTRVLAWFTVATPISFLVGGPLSIWLLQMHGTLGLAGWQWMFIIEGVPACILGLITLKVLSNQPSEAKWLTAHERDVLTGMLADEQTKGRHSHGFTAALRDPRVWILSSITFSFTLGSYGIGIWLPQMLKGHGVEVSLIGWVAAIPYFFATVGLLIWAKHVDRTGKGILNLTLAMLLAGVALLVALQMNALIPALAGITMALVGTIAGKTIFYTLPGKFLRGQAAAGGIALINSIGAFGGFVGPYLMGFLKDYTGSFNAGLMAMGCIMFVAAAMVMSLRLFLREE
ncbi:MFS transporter [Pseudomonas sp. GD03842]|uniref:MFS transporter n=1 Tax=unclassified Pseudomonas TaxID=196821 RepID=UPI000D365D7F|nr:MULTISPECIES: MFS transporter [unclassified Pseudomonas]MDH0746852.1 MFS transporter [Pseudomonas sp. GD03842]RAU43900.1 MFS transporter [Pseudomonas sp. RIT 409]RAU56206.1 MFS transporter [Pseudomonas sp. RIT 412]